MSELASIDQRNRRLRRSYGGGTGGGSGRDVSPDSVIYSFDSSFNLFSTSASASASVERCSSASDVFDRESLASEMSLHSSVRGSDPDPNKSSSVRKNVGPYEKGKKVEKAEAIKEYIGVDTDGEIQTLYSARSSFSHTTKATDCQNRKSRSEILSRKSDRRRPASLDLNNQAMNVTGSSPRLGAAMKSSVSAHRSGMFQSPGTPNYHPSSFGVQKGWSSERVPLHPNTNRIMSTPYNNGRTLPSKWEDAERWIISPAAVDNALKPSVQQQKRPKSKSGPLGPHGSAYHSMYSPATFSFEGRNARSFVTESLFSTGVNMDNNSMMQYQNELEYSRNFPSVMDHSIARSVSLHGCSEVLSHSLLRITQDDKNDGLVDAHAATNVSRDVSRRDMATQMSPEGSPCSSPRKMTSISLSSSTLAIDLHHVCPSKADIRDVQVDDQVTLTRFSKKSRGRRLPVRGSDLVDDWINEASDMRKSLSKVKREEAKIIAWENLQKAKADAAIRKLEMKLEKKRSSSMDRIVHKLQLAQRKAQEMRESLSNQSHQVARSSSHKAISLIKTCQIRSLTGCFTCPAY